MADVNQSFLDKKPTLDELCEYIVIGVKWYQLGIQLKLNVKLLCAIDEQPREVTYKTSKMFELWLDTNPHASRRHVVEALRKEVIGETSLADYYVKTLMEFALKEEALKEYLTELSQYLNCPVKVAQLLFSERCISEAALDKIETLEDSLDGKKTTLLSAIQTTVSSNHKMLKKLACSLSKFKETKLLSERITREYGQKFLDDQTMAFNDQEVSMTGRSSHEDRASDIFRCHYGTVSQSLQCPVRVSQLLCEERVISDKTLSIVKSAAQSPSDEGEKSTYLLLKAIRHAIHTNYNNLKVFASVLLKFANNVPCGNALLKDFEEAFPDDDTFELQSNNIDNREDSPLTTTSTGSVVSSSTLSQNDIPIPRSLKSVFGSIRKKFAITFSKAREAINANPPPLKKLKEYLEDGYPHLQPKLASCNSIDEVLNVVRDHCSLTNISCLEGIVERFNLKAAEAHIQAYKSVVQKFCKETKVNECLNESFKVTKSPSLLRCETAVFVLKWDPKDCTLEDINDLLSEALEMDVEIRCIKEGRSIIVICFFPLNITTLLITKAQETLEAMKKKGLIKLTIGCHTIYDEQRKNEEIKAIVEENIKELRQQLEAQQDISRKKNMEIESFVRQNKERQREIETLQEIVTSLTLKVRERDKENEELKKTLKSLAFLSKAREPVSSDQGLEVENLAQTSQEESVSEDKKSSLLELKESSDKGSESGKGDTSYVQWYGNIIRLYSPTPEQCKEVTSQLKGEQVEKEWSIFLFAASSESACVIMDALNMCAVWKLATYHTPLDEVCVSTLSEILTINATLKIMHLSSSQLAGDVKLFCEALSVNVSLEIFELYDITITDEDLAYFSDMLNTNKTLKELHLVNCDITDDGIHYVVEGLAKNQTLTVLDISRNSQITSVSTSTLVELIKTNESLTELRLRNKSLKDDDITEICIALASNNTIQELWLYEQHRETCEMFDGFESIKNRLSFW